VRPVAASFGYSFTAANGPIKLCLCSSLLSITPAKGLARLSCTLLPHTISIGRHHYTISDCLYGTLTHAYKALYAMNVANSLSVLARSLVLIAPRKPCHRNFIAEGLTSND